MLLSTKRKGIGLIMHHYIITVSYDGSSFNGWQRLSENDNTIQHIIEKTLSGLLLENISLRASGRTDAGVHAICQTADFFCRHCPDDDLLYAANKELPKTIKITSLTPVSGNFHSRKSALSKTYVYALSLSPVKDVFGRKYVYSPADSPVNTTIAPKNNSTNTDFNIDIDKIRQAATLLTGTHDFSAFTTDKTPGKSHVRTIFSIDINIHTTKSGKKILLMEFTGSGFLYNMVRILSGTLLYCGLGKITPDSIPELLQSGLRCNAGPTLPGYALFLKKVHY